MRPGVVRCGRRPAAAGRAQSALRGGLALQRRRSGGAVGRFFGPKSTETPGMLGLGKMEMNGGKIMYCIMSV